MKLEDLKPSITAMNDLEKVSLVRKRRFSRKQSVTRPAAVRKKIDRKANIRRLLNSLSSEDLAKLMEALK